MGCKVINVRVVLFDILAQEANKNSLNIQLKDEATIHQVLQCLDKKFNINPSARLILQNNKMIFPFMLDKIKLKNGNVISVIPLISGGR